MSDDIIRLHRSFLKVIPNSTNKLLSIISMHLPSGSWCAPRLVVKEDLKAIGDLADWVRKPTATLLFDVESATIKPSSRTDHLHMEAYGFHSTLELGWCHLVPLQLKASIPTLPPSRLHSLGRAKAMHCIG